MARTTKRTTTGRVRALVAHITSGRGIDGPYFEATFDVVTTLLDARTAIAIRRVSDSFHADDADRSDAKHALKDADLGDFVVTIRGYLTSWGDHSARWYGNGEYHAHSVDLATAERMTKTLRYYTREMEKIADLQSGPATSPGWLLHRIATVIGATVVLIKTTHNPSPVFADNTYNWMSLNDARVTIDTKWQQWDILTARPTAWRPA